MPPPTPAHQKSASQSTGHVPMWDSSDPKRSPAPLPPNPKPGSPRTNSFDSAPNSREVSPIRRDRDEAMNSHSLQGTPSRNPPFLTHKRANSNQPSPSVREMQNLIMNGSHASPTRNGTPTPKELFGSSTTFPTKHRDSISRESLNFAKDSFPKESFSKESLKDQFQKDAYTKEYSSADYRKSLDFDRAPNLPPLSRNLTTPAEMGTPTPPPHSSNALTTTRLDPDMGPSKLTVHEFATLTSQLSGLTAIANSLQREMTNLSRRSKDNATDLIALKEATKNRDEDIRRSLREMAQNIGPGETSRKLLEQARTTLPLITNRSDSSRSSSYASDVGELVEASKVKPGAFESRILEKIAQDMSTKEDQERTIEILNDIKEALKPGIGRSEAEEQILSILEEIKDREDSRGKELVIAGSRTAHEAVDQSNERIITALEDLKEDILHEKSGERRILALLEELKEKEHLERDDERIVEALEELKEKGADERLDTVISILNELKAREGNEQVLKLLEEVKHQIENITQDIQHNINSAIMIPPPGSSSGQSSTPSAPASSSLPADRIMEMLSSLKEVVEGREEAEKSVKDLVDDWRAQWTGRDKDVGEALKDLSNQLEILATEQRTAMARLPYITSPSHHSQALTTTNPPLPPDLDNEAAITALANIASTTTRTDITLSSINALVKVFQKETQSINNNNAETLTGMGHFLDELSQTVTANGAHFQDIRKVLEVVRTGVQSGNDRSAAYEGASATKIDELLYLLKILHKSILGSGDEAPWKQDIGVKDEVETLRDIVEDVAQKNLDAVNNSTEKITEAIEVSNPASLIAGLKADLGAMAQRSLEAFQKADSREELKLLRDKLEETVEKNLDAINNSSSADAIAEFRQEVVELLQKSISISEAIESKDDSAVVQEILSGMRQELTSLVETSTTATMTESAGVKAAVDALKVELEKMVEDSLTTAVAAATADDKTAAALDELKTEVSNTLSKAVTLSEKPDDSERLLEPIANLRREVQDMMEKSMTALAAPAHFPEADEIKARIETLAADLGEAMQKTTSMAADSLASSAEADAEVKAAVEELRKNIGEMGTTIAAAVASNSASAVEESISNAFDQMKHQVLQKMEKGLQVSDRAVAATAEVSEHIKESLEELKQQVRDVADRSVSTAIIKPDEPEPNLRDTLDSFKKDISAVIEKSLAENTDNSEVKELVAGLKVDVAEMMDKNAAMIAIPPASSFDGALKQSLEDMKKDITEIVQKISTASTNSTSENTKEAIDGLRKAVQEMMEKTASTVALPSQNQGRELLDAGAVEKIEELLSNLKNEMNDMVERSLAAAIANSTFDSEESVKESLEELKRDVKDTLEKSMMPAPPPKEDISTLIREAMGFLRQDIATMLEKKSAGDVEDREEVLRKLEALRSQFAELLEMSSSVEVKEAVEGLAVQMNELPEKLLSSDFMALLKAATSSVRDTSGAEIQSLPGSPSNGEIKEVLESVRERVDKLAERPVDGEIKESVDSLKVQVESLADKTADDGIKESLLALTALVEVLAEKSKDDEIQDAIEALKSDMQTAMEKSTMALDVVKPNAGEINHLILELKKEVLEALKGVSTARGLEQLKSELKNIITEKALAIQPAPTTSPDIQTSKVMAALEGLRKEVRELIEKSNGAITVVQTSPDGGVPFNGIPDMSEMKDTIGDVNSAVGEARVEIAILNALVDEKNNEVKDAVLNIPSTILGQTKTEASTIKEAIQALQTKTKEDLGGVGVSVSEVRSQVQEGVSGLTEDFNGMKEEMKDGFEELNKTVEGAQVEIKEVITATQEKSQAGQEEIKQAVSTVQTAVEESRAEAKENISTLSTTVATSQAGLKEDISAVKKTVDSSHTASLAEHQKTQKRVDDVLSLVDGLQGEWKGQQPTLFNALLEMKHLLLEAHKAAAKKPDLEALMPPPPYDDSQTQQKLDMLIAGNSNSAKYLPQLDLLDSIQKQVAATSADIQDFLSMQRTTMRDEAAAKVQAARQAELDLERALSEKRLIEAATESLRLEHDKFQATVDTLCEEADELRATKLRLTGDVAGLETALRLRREELVTLEARGEALERRMLEGVIEQSRVLLMKPKPTPGRDAGMRKSKNSSSKAKGTPGSTPGNTIRRHLSLSQITNDAPGGGSGRTSLGGTGSLGLGGKDYSGSLGLGRSHSVKQTSFTGGRMSSSERKALRVPSAGKENERQPIVKEEDVDDLADEPEYILADGASRDVDDDEGSVMRLDTEVADLDAEESLRRKSKKYPGLALDFSGRDSAGSAADQRSISGVST